jgi:hypothetical protein
MRGFSRIPRIGRNVIGQDLMRIQYRWPVGMPLCRPLSGGLWEVRSSLPGDRIGRVLFFVEDARIGVVHGFVKRPKRRRRTPLPWLPSE